MLKLLTEQLRQSRSLTEDQVAEAVAQLVDEQVASEIKADFLSVLARKGETTGEIAAFARELRARSLAPPIDVETRAREILDVCGTGGDRLNTFNISTTVALVVASAGITVAKHGNRAITSQSGSADVLQALGIPVELTPADAAASLREHHFAFFFAQQFHPAFRHIAPARKLCAERGERTIFNILGPLLNPARPSAQLVGVPRPELCEPVARALQSLGVRRGMVVCGLVDAAAGAPATCLDELSTLGDTHVAEFYQERGFAVSLMPRAHFGLQPATLADLAGGNSAANAEIIRRLLSGVERGPKREAVLLNAAAALFVAGQTESLTEGWEQAARLIDNGQAQAKLRELSSIKP